MNEHRHDLAIIGGGPGGYVAAIRAAQLGLDTVVIEREHMGGICLNWGCIPTKAMLRSAEVFHLLKRSKEFGISAESINFELDSIVNRSRMVANQLSSGVSHLMKKNGIRVISGHARFTSALQLTVTNGNSETTISASNVVIATGARAREIQGLESDGDLVWNYRHALIPARMPQRLLVVGSGAIGIEFASFYSTLGAKTTVVELLDTILPAEDREISAFAKKQFEKQGITFHERSTVTRLERIEGKVEVTIKTAEESLKETFDTVISAVGIVGNVEDIGLEEIGVEVDRTHILVDQYCRTDVPGVYAIGDVAGAPWLAHKASHEGVVVAELIAGLEVHPVHPDTIAGCTYSMPQVASVGMTEAEAKEGNKSIRVGRFPFIGNGKAIALGESEGLVKTIFDSETGELLGAHMVGAEVTELIQGYVVGRQLETTEVDLMRAVFPHPTLSEMMHESVLNAYDRTIHM